MEKEMRKQYETVIGLEIHVELKTESKIFCGCKTDFGAPPNTQCCPVCTGMPGALPVFNRKVLHHAIKAGSVLNCHIAAYSAFDRKNYFYPDLPKGYQITQFYHPICENGFLDIETKNGVKRIGITRIHIEEDAGKLIHDPKLGTLIDCNRCGVPLIEIVTEPDFSDAEEVKTFLKLLRSYLLYAEVSDCKMNEGSMRCDVNLSVRKKGDTALGTRTEMKNLNSFQFIGKAIEYEFARQVDLSESGQQVRQETRRFDQNTGKTHAMREKETAADYRYFPEPDLPPLLLSEQETTLHREIIELPDRRIKRYQSEFGLSKQQSEQLCALPQTAVFFDALMEQGTEPNLAANLLLAELCPKVAEGEKIPVGADRFAAVCRLLAEGSISNATARKVIAALLLEDLNPERYVKEKDLLQITDPEKLKAFALAAIESDPKSVAAFVNGKTAAAQAIVGKAIKCSGGKADPSRLREAVFTLLSKSNS